MNPLWNEIASRAAVALSPQQHETLSQYIDLLLAANRTMNLTRITDRESAEVRHVGDSLTVLPHMPPGALRLADLGSGGGAPGIPLAIARPDAVVVLIESTKKKAAFLRQTARELALNNVEVSDQRAEVLGQTPAFRESFDVVVARAVGTMNWLGEWGLPLLKVGGKLLAMKGPQVVEELPPAEHAIRLLGGSSPDIHSADLPGAHHHVIVEISKIRRTPGAYPRPPTAAKGKQL